MRFKNSCKKKLKNVYTYCLEIEKNSKLTNQEELSIFKKKNQTII